jgi:uncharacterized protein
VIATRALATAFCAVSLFAACAAAAKDTTTPIVIRAGKVDSPSHALAVQFAEAIAATANSTYTLDVQESQGSIENVIEAPKLGRNTIFTAAPNVIAEARRGAKPFSHNPRYNEIRALFPLPPLTEHWVVRQDSGVKSLADLAGQSFIPGPRGSIGERLTTAALQLLGIDKQVQLIDIDLAAASAAMKAKQVSGLALAGNYPVPTLLDLARTTPIRLITLPPADLAKMVAADDSTATVVVPKGTYPGVDEDVTTIAVPSGAYTTLRMRDSTAYALTKAFWSRHATLVQRYPPWQAVDAEALATLKVKLHKGALRYYDEAGMKVPRALR